MTLDRNECKKRSKSTKQRVKKTLLFCSSQSISNGSLNHVNAKSKQTKTQQLLPEITENETVLSEEKKKKQKIK